VSQGVRVLGVITARGGSRGVPRKNLREVGGTSLVALAVRQAAAASSLARTIVSTEDEEIARTAREAGGDVPFMRPAGLAEDTTPTLPVLLHALEQCEAAGDPPYTHVCILQPTSPLRLPADIDRAVAAALVPGADSAVTVSETVHPVKLKRIEDGELVPYVEPEQEGVRRQDLGVPAYARNGAVYVIRRETLLAGRLFGDHCRAVVMPRERSIDVNGPADLVLVEALWHIVRPADSDGDRDGDGAADGGAGAEGE